MPIGGMKFTRFASNLHPYTQSWVDRVVTAGGTVSSPRQAVVDTFVKGLIADGLIDGSTISNSLIQYLLLLASDGFTGCNVPLIDAGIVGNATLFNFVSSDYGTTGLTGNGSTKYLDTKSIASNYLTYASGSSIGQYSSAGTVNSATYGRYGAEQATASRFEQYFNSDITNGNDVGFQIFDESGYVFSNSSYVHGFQLGNRAASSSALRELRNGTFLRSTSTLGTASPPTIPLYLFATNDGIAATGFYSFTVQFVFFGKGFTTAQEAVFSSRVATLVSTLP